MTVPALLFIFQCPDLHMSSCPVDEGPEMKESAPHSLPFHLFQNPQINPFWVLSPRAREPNPSLSKAALDISWSFQSISDPSEERCLSWQRRSLPAAGVGSAAAPEGVRTIKEFSFCPSALRSPSQTLPGCTGKSSRVSAYQPHGFTAAADKPTSSWGLQSPP